MTTYYMHLLDGKPAYFDRDQVCFMMRGGFTRAKQTLCVSLKQIRSEQKRSGQWREQQGYSDHDWEYSYVRVVAPEEPTP